MDTNHSPCKTPCDDGLQVVPQLLHRNGSCVQRLVGTPLAPCPPDRLVLPACTPSPAALQYGNASCWEVYSVAARIAAMLSTWQPPGSWQGGPSWRWPGRTSTAAGVEVCRRSSLAVDSQGAPLQHGAIRIILTDVLRNLFSTGWQRVQEWQVPLLAESVHCIRAGVRPVQGHVPGQLVGPVRGEQIDLGSAEPLENPWYYLWG